MSRAKSMVRDAAGGSLSRSRAGWEKTSRPLASSRAKAMNARPAARQVPSSVGRFADMPGPGLMCPLLDPRLVSVVARLKVTNFDTPACAQFKQYSQERGQAPYPRSGGEITLNCPASRRETCNQLNHERFVPVGA